MTPFELLELCQKQIDLGLDRVVLLYPRPKSWRPHGSFKRKVKTIFGLCDYGGSADPQKIIIWVDVNKVMQHLKKISELKP